MGENILFSIVLKEAVDMMFEGNLTEATKYLNDNSCPISYSTMRSYVGNFTLPSYSRAEKILNTLKYRISQEDLLSCLEYSSKQLFENKRDEKYYTTSIRINPCNIDEELTVSDMQELISKRCADIFDDDNSKGFTSYITKLIKDDLINNRLIKN